MASFVDISPNGVETWVDGDEANRLQVHYRQDVEPVLDLCARERNDRIHDNVGNADLSLYARLPPVVILEMRHKHGVDIFKKDQLKKAFALINSEYPHCKTSNLIHTVRGLG